VYLCDGAGKQTTARSPHTSHGCQAAVPSNNHDVAPKPAVLGVRNGQIPDNVISAESGDEEAGQRYRRAGAGACAV
jgi:hypothetical protein